jgi:hypothetical protein
MITLFLSVAASAQAQLTSPQVGWQAELSRLAHNVSGRVTILDANTLQVDGFTYDGGGIDVFFYLGHENTRTSFQSGLRIGPQLLGTAYNGTGPPLVLDLPTGQTLEGWNAISVWCVTAAANFGSGTFAPRGDFNDDGSVDAADYVTWRNGLGGEYEAAHYAQWRAHFGTVSAAVTSALGAFSTDAVPEPGTMRLFVATSMLGLLWARAKPGRRSG